MFMKMTLNSIEYSRRNWVPTKFVYEGKDLKCRWLYVDGVPFLEPFFDETVVYCRSLPENAERDNCVTSCAQIEELAADVVHVAPTAFIFHVSRCGSTLLSQALGMDPKNISLSEVPFLDEILRLPFRFKEAEPGYVSKLFTSALKLYGAKRTMEEERLFIKTDSWHLVFYNQLRAMYPDTPFVILYRHPTEVLRSNKRKKGMQGVPELVEPELFGFGDLQEESRHPDKYIELVLEKYFNYIIGIAAKDGNVLLIDYKDGVLANFEKIARFAGMDIGPEQELRIKERAQFHGKHRDEKFVEINTVRNDADPSLSVLEALYERVERLRLNGVATR
jgi:hypothetical protein